ncbi:MAG: DNA polymerase III subunit gamma/tau, partial [Sphingopyxis sp.]
MPAPTLQPANTAAGAYRVLARKYRPQRFAELIGQDAMVQTLANAIKRERLAHAFLMTGVRGVGKTSTARLIAKGLNCTGADGQGGPTIDPCGACDACVAIAEGRHIDVIEMDAASHTGVDDVREIIEAVRYSAVSARYKIYIIDEVHMLSKNAFNALLKTLEEPPPHVKFIFATTEVGKVPITVLSRCQRFDLRRITPDLLFAHFAQICEAEQVVAEDGALRLIAAAAEGSVRDGLSILDQAIAHASLEGTALDSAGAVSEAQVREMLGLADGGATRRLFGYVLAGEAAAALDEARAGYALGVEPIAMLRGAMALAHGTAMTRVARGDDPSISAEDRAAVREWAGQMGMAQLQRLWQLLLRAHDEVTRAAAPFEALEMALLRLTHAARMPDPDALAQMLGNAGHASAASSAAPLAQPAPS